MTELKTGDQILSPVGEIVFMAIKTPAKKYQSEEKEFSIRLRFSEDNPEHVAFKEQVAAIAPKKILSAADEHVPGHFHLVFKSGFQPKVLDETLTEVDEIPQFYGVSKKMTKAEAAQADTGKARVLGIVNTNGANNTIYLSEVMLQDLDIKPRELGRSSMADLLDNTTQAEVESKLAKG